MKVIEENITKTDYNLLYPGSEEKISQMAKWIDRIYTQTQKEMPIHVRDWITKHTL
jgi:hypothetical protein